MFWLCWALQVLVNPSGPALFLLHAASDRGPLNLRPTLWQTWGSPSVRACGQVTGVKGSPQEETPVSPLCLWHPCSEGGVKRDLGAGVSVGLSGLDPRTVLGTGLLTSLRAIGLGQAQRGHTAECHPLVLLPLQPAQPSDLDHILRPPRASGRAPSLPHKWLLHPG